MPSVPVYGQPQVRQAALPSARVSTEAPDEAFGGGRSAAGVGEAVKGVANVAHGIFEQEQQKADQVRLLEKRRALNDWEQQAIYDPKTGAKNRLGKNAFGVQDELPDSFDKFAAEQGKDLTDNQRQAFEAMAAARREHVVGWANDHVGQQQKAIQDHEFAASLESSKERGSNDPRNAPGEVNFIKTAVELRAHSEGWGPDQLKQELQKNTSDLHARVVTGMLARDSDIAASAYLENVKDNLDPDIKTKLTEVLEAGSLKGRSQRSTDQIMATSKTMTDALAAAKGLKDPKERDEVERRVTHAFELQKVAKRDETEKQFLNATNIIERTKNFDAIPTPLLNAMPLSERSALRSYAEHTAIGKNIAPLSEDYYNLRTMAVTPELRDNFLQKNLLTYKGKVANNELESLIDIQTGLRKGDPKAQKTIDGIQTDQQIVNSAITSALKLPPTPKPGTTAAETVRDFRRAVDVEAAAYKEQNKKAFVPNEELQKIVDRLTIKKVTETHWYGDTKKFSFQLPPDQQPVAIPATERVKLESALKRNRIAPTEANILGLYKRAKGK